MVIVLYMRLTLDQMSSAADIKAVMREFSSGLSSLCGITDISKPIGKYPSQKGGR